MFLAINTGFFPQICRFTTQRLLEFTLINCLIRDGVHGIFLAMFNDLVLGNASARGFKCVH